MADDERVSILTFDGGFTADESEWLASEWERLIEEVLKRREQTKDSD